MTPCCQGAGNFEAGGITALYDGLTVADGGEWH